jgi:hypothetical protein
MCSSSFCLMSGYAKYLSAQLSCSCNHTFCHNPFLADLAVGNNTSQKDCCNWSPEPGPAKYFAVFGALLEWSNQLFRHRPPLLAIGVPFRAWTIAPSSLAAPARRKPQSCEKKVDQASKPSQREQPNRIRVERNQARDQAHIINGFGHSDGESNRGVGIDRP